MGLKFNDPLDVKKIPEHEIVRFAEEYERIMRSWQSEWCCSQMQHGAGPWIVHKPGANRPFKSAPFKTEQEASEFCKLLNEKFCKVLEEQADLSQDDWDHLLKWRQ